VSDVLTVDDVAELLKCSPKTVPTLGLPSHKVGRFRRYLKAEVLAWIAAQPGEVAA
jgi:excisionase family DNA binding protein